MKRARQWPVLPARLKALMTSTTVVASGAVLLSACTVVPDYKQPHADAPPAWHTDSYWRLAEPSHAPLAPDWWRSFGDASSFAVMVAVTVGWDILTLYLFLFFAR